MRNQEIIFALAGQSFFYDVPEGRPSAPAVSVFLSTADDDGQLEAATSNSCTVDAVDTTTSAAAAAGDRALVLASITGIKRGRRYLVTGADGELEQVEVMTVDPSGSRRVGLRRPLTNAFASGAAFQGCRISIDVNTTWASDKQKLTDILLDWRSWRTSQQAVNEWDGGFTGYRLRWTYSVAGVACVGVSYADLVRYAAKNLVSPADVDNRFPGWINRLATDYREDQGAELILEAFRAVKMDALADNQQMRRFRDTEVLGQLIMFRANVLAVEANVMQGAAAQATLEAAEKAYRQRYDTLIRQPKIPVDQTGGGSSAKATRLPPFRR